MKQKLLILLLATISSVALAQNRTLTGTVTSKDDGEPLIGASVVVTGTPVGTTTDIDGNYTLQVPETASAIEVSYIGFVKQTITIGDQSVINVALAADVKTLNDVVVVGYGTQKKSDLTGSVSSMRSEDINKIPSPSAEQALQGKVAGVQVTTPSGAPGSTPVIRVRGVGTFNNASPIFVVDGVILDDISFLSPSDIATMEVLKDASATAIYGSRGSNGVIIITTKQGKGVNGKPQISFSTDFSIQHLAKEIDLLNGPEFGSYVNDFAPGTYNNLDALTSTNWQDLVFSDAPMYNVSLSASGASDRSTYYVGMDYFHQQGIVDKSSYQRVSLKFNNSFTLSKHIKVGNNLTFAPYAQQNAPDVTYGAYRAQPTIIPYNADGSFAEVPGVGNPLADLEYSNDYTRGIRTVGNIYGEVTFLKNFLFRSSFGSDLGYQEGRSYTPVFYVSPAQQNETSDLNVGNSHFADWLWENTLTYKKDVGKSSFDILGGYTMQRATSGNFSASGENILGSEENLWYINPDNLVPASVSNGVDADNDFALISYLFRVNYTWSGKYLLTATFRRDGSSKFTENNRYGNFPSFALGWNIAQENFMKKVPAITTMKIRASWGIIGNEKINYLDQYALVENQQNAVFGENEVLVPGSSYGKTGNPNLKWESTKQTDLGLELGFLKNRLTGEFDFYSRTTDDILVDLSTPGYTGNGEGVKVRYNAGSVLNRGLDFNVAWQDQVGQFNYRIAALGSTVHNEVLSIGGNSGVDSVLIGGDLGNGQTVTMSTVGLPIGSFFGYHTIGIFQNQTELDTYPHESLTGAGDLIYEDVNGDGIISDQDRVYLGSPIPKLIFGFSLEGGWKGWGLSLDFQGQTGNKLYNGKEAVRPDLYNFEHHVVDRWTGEGTSNTEPRASSGGVNWDPSNRFIQDGSFLRLRSATISYNLPKNVAAKLLMSDATVYLRGTNVFTATQWTGYTPEIGGSDVLSNGIDLGTYPITAVYTVGLNVTF